MRDDRKPRIVIFVEGITDLKMILGLLGYDIKGLRKSETMAYRCYVLKYVGQNREHTVICEGGGKDEVCNRVNYVVENNPNILEIDVLLDGDAKDKKCEGAKMYYLSHKNLDELIYEFINDIINDQKLREGNWSLINNLYESERSNEDSKKKLYFAMYVIRRFAVNQRMIGKSEYWSDASAFTYFLGLNYGDKLMSLDDGLKSFVNKLKGFVNSVADANSH